MKKLLKFLNNNILFIGVAFLLFFIPLYPKFPLISVSGTYVSIRLEDIFVSLLIFIFAIKLLLNRDYSLFKWKITRLILLYFLIGLLSLVSGIFITKNVTPHIAFLHYLRRIEYLSLLFISYYSFKELKQLKTFGLVIFISTLGVIAYALGQKFYGWPVVSTMNKEFSKGMILKLTWWARVNSTFAGHYDLAAYMVMILSLVTVSLMIIKKWIIKILIFILGLFSYYILVLTGSRISFAAYLVAILFILTIRKKFVWIFPFLVVSLMGMALSADLGQRYAATFKIDTKFLSSLFVQKEEVVIVPTPIPEPTLIPTPTPKVTKPIIVPTLAPTPTIVVATAAAEYFEPTALAVGRSTDIRLKVEWPRAIAAFLKNPILGTGYSSITLATDNDYLRMLGETGLLGTLAFILFMLEILRRGISYLKIKSASREGKLLVLGIFGAAIGFLINAGFIDVLEASKIAFFFWILIGVALKIIDLDKQNQL